MRKPTPEHLSYFPVKYSVGPLGWLTALLPEGRVVLGGKDPYKMCQSIATYWTDAGPEKVDIPCVCGARKIGVPDFSPGHSGWCNHTPREVK